MKYISVYEYGERYGFSHTHVYRAAKDGTIPADQLTTIGNAVAINEDFRLPAKRKPGRKPVSEKNQHENQQVS